MHIRAAVKNWNLPGPKKTGLRRYSLTIRIASYTTTLKLLQIMTEKGLVDRNESARTHVYKAAYSQDQTQHQLVTDLLERAFDGSAARLVMQALASQPASPEELTEIRRLLDKKRGGPR